MTSDLLDTLVAISVGVLAVLSVAALLVAIWLPRAKRTAVLRHIGRKWII